MAAAVCKASNDASRVERVRIAPKEVRMLGVSFSGKGIVQAKRLNLVVALT